MNTANNILDELKTMGSNLGSLPRSMPYHVPEGYFGHFAADVAEMIGDIDRPEPVSAWGKAMPHSVPNEYFEHLSGNILSYVHSREALDGLPAEMPFSVPAGYFDALPMQMLAVAKASDAVQKTAKTIPLTRRYTVPSIRWAAAAILLIFIGFGGFFYLGQPSADTDKILASVPQTEIQDYLQNTLRIDVDRVVHNDVSNLQVDNKEIVEYLNETGWDVTD